MGNDNNTSMGNRNDNCNRDIDNATDGDHGNGNG